MLRPRSRTLPRSQRGTPPDAIARRARDAALAIPDFVPGAVGRVARAQMPRAQSRPGNRGFESCSDTMEHRTKTEDDIKRAEQHEALKQTLLRLLEDPQVQQKLVTHYTIGSKQI